MDLAAAFERETGIALQERELLGVRMLVPVDERCGAFGLVVGAAPPEVVFPVRSYGSVHLIVWAADVKKLDKAMQAAVLRAGKEAGAYGRQIESGEDEQKLAALEKAGKLKRVPFSDRSQMKKLVDPVMAQYAKEIGADQILAKINALK